MLAPDGGRRQTFLVLFLEVRLEEPSAHPLSPLLGGLTALTRVPLLYSLENLGNPSPDGAPRHRRSQRGLDLWKVLSFFFLLFPP